MAKAEVASESAGTPMEGVMGGVRSVEVRERRRVKELLEELGLLHRHFVVLVDGRRAKLEDEIEEGQRVLVLPIIAGG